MLKIACPGLIRALSCSPNGVYCAGAISEKIFIWQESCFFVVVVFLFVCFLLLFFGNSENYTSLTM